MIGALWTGISGLAAEQTALDNESHNIANVNTVGYKASRISFADQMYQDKIGKGAKILDAEKLFVQGNLKLTGVAYDMALTGDGFFAVSNKSASGTSETFYTRAGNFRMGDNGTLQDSAGNEVQGWAMSPLDADNDVRTTNPNISVFTNDYNQLITSKVVKHSNYIETYTAKATDYASTAKSDPESVFTGAGQKTKASKVEDVEELIKDYTSWVQKIQETPDGPSATSIAQTTQIRFEGTDFKKEGDEIYIYLDGDKVTQNFVSKTTTQTLTAVDLDGNGTVDGDDQNLAASRIATYKALADTISNKPGFEAYTIIDDGNGIFDATDTFNASTADADVLYGMIEIKSLIPGQEFKITEVAERSGNNTVYGNYNESASSTAAFQGSGVGALESSRAALMEAIVGKQRDIYTTTNELYAMNGMTDYNYQITLYSKDTGTNITVPTSPLTITNPTSVDDFVTAINTDPELLDQVFAQNVNGALVVKTLDKNSDVEFSGALTTNNVLDATEYVKSQTATAALPEIGKITLTSMDPTQDFTFSLKVAAGATETNTVTGAAIQAQMIAGPNTASESLAILLDAAFDGVGDTNLAFSANGNEITITGPVGAANVLSDISLINTANNPIDKNADFSGREGAGAEFIEIINKIDQTSSKDSLQLRLDTLNISDSAFGEFSVDSSGLITMKQDGAEFAIGQVAIALFNNQRGLEPAGDNLMAKTNSSGEPIFNINNDKTAKIDGKTLELSTADLSESLVNLMVFQRAFEANAKSITTSDELLSTLINLKR